MTTNATPKRPALGRGLTSLMSQMAPEDAAQRELPIGSLNPNRQQPRTYFDEQAIHDLSESLKQHGMMQPIVVRKVGDKYEIIAGERRWRAAKKAGLAMVPVIVKEIPDDRLLEFALVENIQRQELNPIEEARAYWQLGEHLRLTQEQVADRVGKSRPQVANTLRLLRL
ncbi:MAG TPA: ParB/RepB/Spo0J family partition protein, partial [Holophagaceae bacterium]|nr:ParB/RepB/Spo0J family partition protein [Holophagaceae bacterium]